MLKHSIEAVAHPDTNKHDILRSPRLPYREHGDCEAATRIAPVRLSPLAGGPEEPGWHSKTTVAIQWLFPLLGAPPPFAGGFSSISPLHLFPAPSLLHHHLNAKLPRGQLPGRHIPQGQKSCVTVPDEPTPSPGSMDHVPLA